MAPGLFSRFASKKGTLEADLKRVTESNVVEVPKELLDAVVEAAQGEDDRREIMRHLRECLAEPSGRRWRRVHAALVLIEELAKRGPQELLVETAQGHHFDLVQRLSLLERFDCTTDRRVQNMVRAKATALRQEMVPRLQAAGDESLEAIKDTVSTCSPATAASSGTAGMDGASPAFSNLTALSPRRPEGMMILNGIVAVGHNDDTTDESSGDEGPKRAVQYRQQKKVGAKGTAGPGRHGHDSGASSDSENSAPVAARPQAAQAAPQSVDLLEL